MGEHLADNGWTMWPTAHATLLYLSPDGLTSAEWVKAGYPIEIGALPVAWQISARSHTHTAATEWSAYFTEGMPFEALIGFLDALQPNGPSEGSAGDETVLTALTRLGWERDIDYPDAASPPGLTATVSLESEPPLIRASDPRETRRGWQAWAEPAIGASYLWCACFSAGSPPDLVAAFATSLASPEPVPRRTLPRSAQGHLRIVHRT